MYFTSMLAATLGKGLGIADLTPKSRSSLNVSR